MQRRWKRFYLANTHFRVGSSMQATTSHPSKWPTKMSTGATSATGIAMATGLGHEAGSIFGSSVHPFETIFHKTLWESAVADAEARVRVDEVMLYSDWQSREASLF